MTSRYVTRKDREKALKQTNFTFKPCGMLRILMAGTVFGLFVRRRQIRIICHVALLYDLLIRL